MGEMRQLLPGIALVGCVMAGAVSASAQQPACDDWGTRAFFVDADPATVAECLDARTDIYARIDPESTPLHNAAASNDNPAVIRALVDAGAAIDARDGWDLTPLHAAATYNDNPAVIRALVDAGAAVDARTIYGQTPLHLAARQSRDNSAVITVLLEAGANIHASEDSDKTPLHVAAVYNPNPAVITALVDAGADVNARNKYEWSPLQFAARHNPNPAVITALLAAGGDPLARVDGGESPWEMAGKRSDSAAFVAAFSAEAIAAFKEQQREDEAAAREQEVERQLREARVACEKWNTPAFFRHAGVEDVTRCLADNDPNAPDDQGRAPLRLAALEGRPEVMAALAEAGADPDALDGNGRTPLHLVAYFGTNPEIVSALVRAGADLAALDSRGRTPLEFAERFSEAPAIVTALRDAMAAAAASGSCHDWNTARFFRNATVDDVVRCLDTEDPNARNQSGRTPMHYAAQGALPALVLTLAEAGAGLNAPDGKGGWTPLHLAAWFGTKPSVVAALLAVGADPAARDNTGKTPWDYARENAALEDTPPYWRLQEEASE